MSYNIFNRKNFLLCLLCMVVALGSIAAPTRKVLDDGGSGPFKAEAISDPLLPGYVIYRPQDFKAAVKDQGPLPLMVFANGGCNDTSLPHERMLSDLASYGYLVIALGEMQQTIDDRELHTSPVEDMPRAIDWAFEQNETEGSPYYQTIDTEYVALAGMSCGGAMVMANAADSRVKTYLMLNSGMGDMEMAGASKESLKNLQGPILYVIGGESDVAYPNALKDYERITDQPVAFANQLRVGHGGTYHEPYGGSFSPMVRYWLSWQFKDQRNNLDVFLRNRMREFPDWTMMAKNFGVDGKIDNNPYTVEEKHITTRDGKDIFGMMFIPNRNEEKYPFVIMAHGYNGNFQETKPFAETLAMNGIGSYIFDFCGGSNWSRSEGDTTEMTLGTEQQNVEDIAAEAMTWDWVDTDRMALLGCSQGGLLAALTTGANPDLFKAVIYVYPAFMIPDTAPMQLKRFDADNGNPQDVMGMRLGRCYYEYLNGMDVPQKASSFKGKVYTVYGDDDMVAAGGVLDRVLAVYDTANVEVKVIEGGKHGFPDYRRHAQASEGIRDFALKTLRPFNPRAWHHEFDPTYPDVHDPVMAYEDGRYYLFTTGMGVGMLSSDDMKTWKQEKSPLDPIPAWAQELVPAYKGHTWAPDIIKVGDRWYLYYSCSTFAKNISVIGVMTTPSLDPEKAQWEDLGLVIQSRPEIDDFNAIDPNIIIDEQGNPWMTFGSFWDGIQLVQPQKDMKTPVGYPKTIARRRCACTVAHNNEHANTNAIEAPFIIKHDGYYYLFVSYDYCCKGLSSNYKTAVGRSKNVEGPYLDSNGVDMADTGGDILIAETDRYNGVGHCSVYDIDGQTYFIAHAYDKERNGASKLFIRPIRWENGWPKIEK